MWYFSWILGTGFALAFGVLNAIWYEVTDRPDGEPESHPLRSEKPPATSASRP
jgi:cytochrome bd-I ubiquinol oxidase subunit X